KDGDAAYLADKVEWDRVKQTLKVSLAAAALDLPASDLVPGVAEEAEPSAPAAKTSLWQRFKTYLGKNAVDRMVDNYANAEGLPKLFAYRQTYRGAVGHVDEPKTLANLPVRVQRAWSRVRRAVFTSPTRFEMEMADKNDPGRSFAGVLELTGFEWKLVSLHVHQQKPQSAAGTGGQGSGDLVSRLRATATPQLAAGTAPADTGDPQER
ncbi:MAG: DUF2939 domain-containing protein, partial [Hyphomicrobium sp.]